MSSNLHHPLNANRKVPSSLRQQAATTPPNWQPTAMALALALGGAGQAGAQEAVTLQAVQVEAKVFDANPYSEEGAPYKAKVSGDQRRVKELAETPATISVITQAAVKESGKSDLRSILGAQPGITIGTGENGNAFGDRYIIRGHEARSDVFIDGLRDPGMTTRESFAVDQIEITKGPSSTFAGRGSTGGAINSVTKQPNSDKDFTEIGVGFGTDDYSRTTLDTNKVINDRASVRLNLLSASETVPDRDPADKSRRGLLLSGKLKATDQLDLSADYYHLEAKDTPDLGTYFNTTTRKPVKNIPVYLQSGRDHLDTDVDTLTLKAGFRISDKLRLQNSTRIGKTENSYITTGARGATRNANDATAPNTPTVTLSTHQGYQEVEYVVNRLDVFLDSKIAGLNHQFVFGAEFNDEKVLNGVHTAVAGSAMPNCKTGTTSAAAANNAYCAVDGNGQALPNIDRLLPAYVKGVSDSDYHIRTTSLTAMDTVDFNEQWSAFAGLRYDHFDYENVVGTGLTSPKVTHKYSDGFINGNAGLTYKINSLGNVYASVSSSTDINGGESDVGGSCGYGGICVPSAASGSTATIGDSKPEKTLNYEVGTKWQLLQQKLLVTAALFRTIKSDVQEQSAANAYTTIGTLNTGKNRVQGAEFSVVGNLTQKLSTQLGVTVMDSEVLESFTPANKGKQLSNFARKQASAQLKYQFAPKFAVGGAATYQSKMFAGQPDTAAGFNATTGRYNIVVPSYTVFDAFAEYKFSDKLNARLNVNNVTNKDYYLAAYQSGSFMYLGDKRNAHITLTYKF
ncbi:MAG: TonB-dependent receptor [Pseudomonadota bacterium]